MASSETAIDAQSNTKSIRTDDNESLCAKSEQETPSSPKFDITVKSENFRRVATPESKKSEPPVRIDQKMSTSPFKLTQQPQIS